MTRALIFFLFLQFILLNLFSQTKDFEESHSEFSIHVGSQSFYNFSELNKDFSKKGIAKIDENYLFYGASYRKHFSNSLILGISFNTNLLFNKYNTGDSSSSKFNHIGGSVDLGYNLLNTNRYSLYPMISLGINASAIDIKKYLHDEIDWDKLYNSDGIIINEIRRTDLFIKFSLVFDYVIDAGMDDYNIPIGIEIGMSNNLLNIDENSLYTLSGLDIRVNNFPDLYNRSFYIPLVLGLRSK